MRRRAHEESVYNAEHGRGGREGDAERRDDGADELWPACKLA
jgi:hypothetical protein